MCIRDRLFSVPAMAKKNFFSFNVKTSVNDGEAFSAGNPKNDAERQAYVVTPVSYTHLDVYKRQAFTASRSSL